MFSQKEAKEMNIFTLASSINRLVIVYAKRTQISKESNKNAYLRCCWCLARSKELLNIWKFLGEKRFIPSEQQNIDFLTLAKDRLKQAVDEGVLPYKEEFKEKNEFS